MKLLHLLLQSSCQDIQTTIGIEYDNTTCDTNLTAPPKLNLTLPSGSTALDVMEGAVNISRNYLFVVTFLGDTGYRIDSVNGTSSDKECEWHLLVSMPNGTEIISQLHYVLSNDVSTVVLRYTTGPNMVIITLIGSNIHAVSYTHLTLPTIYSV